MKTRGAAHEETLQKYTCLHYKHSDFVHPRDWKCPKCGHGIVEGKLVLDGGSHCCGNKKCGKTFHWCAFKDNFKGGYECDSGPIHLLEAPPPLEMWDFDYTANPNPPSGVHESKKTGAHLSGTNASSLLTEDNTIYNCLHYKHDDRVARDDWKCPKCAAPPGPFGIMDGGSAVCSDCGCHFHWCAFAGDYVHDAPLHHLENPPALEKEKKPDRRKVDIFRCLDYKSPLRVARRDWKCPKCGAPEDMDVILKDGGSASCWACGEIFHWCAFEGGYVCGKTPMHVLDEPPALEKGNAPSGIAKKSKIEVPTTKTFHGVFSYESVVNTPTGRSTLPTFKNCTLLGAHDDEKEGARFSGINVALRLYAGDDDDYKEIDVFEWKFEE